MIVDIKVKKALLLGIGIASGKHFDKLYKYRAIDLDKPDSRLADITENHQLWFSSPKNFNDPFDCQINFDYDITEEELIKFLEGEEHPDPQILAEELLQNKEKFFQFTDKVLKDSINSKGICSFSKSWNSVLQWAYYANGHTGIVLGFDLIKDTSFFAELLDVEYKKEYPICNPIKEQDKFPQILAGTKSKQWQHEDEWRVIEEHEGAYSFRKEALTEIIFGVNTSETDIIAIKNLLDSNGYSHTKLFQIKLKEKEYGLDKKELIY